MNTLTDKLGVVQNIGLVDRLLRLIIGAFLLGGAAAHLQMGGGVMSWHAYAGLISVYPLMTGMLGWDPFYQMFKVKSCSLTGRNQCGTFPYEIDAAMGRDPKPESDYDHSLAGSRHQPG